MNSCRDWSWLVVPRKIRKMSSINLFQKGIAQMKVSGMVSSWRPMKKLACGGAALVPMTVPMSERLLFLRIV